MNILTLHVHLIKKKKKEKNNNNKPDDSSLCLSEGEGVDF